MLVSANLDVAVQASSFAEAPVRDTMVSQGASPAEIARALAAGKAEAVSQMTDDLILGCDQVLSCDGKLFSKPNDLAEARAQMKSLRNRTHHLFSAAVIYEDQKPVWSHVGEVALTMRDFSEEFLEGYLNRNWPGIQSSVGGYKLEEEGVRLFSKTEGDFFTVLGMPLVEILTYLGKRGVIET